MRIPKTLTRLWFESSLGMHVRRYDSFVDLFYMNVKATHVDRYTSIWTWKQNSCWKLHVYMNLKAELSLTDTGLYERESRPPVDRHRSIRTWKQKSCWVTGLYERESRTHIDRYRSIWTWKQNSRWQVEVYMNVKAELTLKGTGLYERESRTHIDRYRSIWTWKQNSRWQKPINFRISTNLYSFHVFPVFRTDKSTSGICSVNMEPHIVLLTCIVNRESV